MDDGEIGFSEAMGAIGSSIAMAVIGLAIVWILTR